MSTYTIAELSLHGAHLGFSPPSVFPLDEESVLMALKEGSNDLTPLRTEYAFLRFLRLHQGEDFAWFLLPETFQLSA